MKNKIFCHPRESGDPVVTFSLKINIPAKQKNTNWVPAFAGMTRRELS